LYFPFKDITADPSMPLNLKRYKDKYADRLTVRQLGDGNRLDNVGDDDMFIIAGHGLPNDNRIGVSVKYDSPVGSILAFFGQTREETITANDLANILMGSGLPKGHKYIKTLTCGGAGMATADTANARFNSTNTKVLDLPLKEVKSENCFASVLAIAMRERDYYQLLVKGYPGFVNATELEKTVTMESDTTKGFAHAHWGDGKKPMVQAPTRSLEEDYWFDGWGKLVWR
jgi:hypothetical protein